MYMYVQIYMWWVGIGMCICVSQQGILYDKLALQNLKEAKQAQPNVSGAVTVLRLRPIKFSVAFTETGTILDFQSHENLSPDFVFCCFV